MVAEVTIIEIGKRRRGMVTSFTTHYADDVDWMRPGNRVEQRRAHPTEDGGIGGYAERQSHYGDEGKAGGLGKNTKGVTEVVNQVSITRGVKCAVARLVYLA